MIGETLFTIGEIAVPSMGVCIAVGAILAVLMSWLIRKLSPLDWNNDVLDAIIWAVLLGFVGMKLLYWIVTPNVFAPLVSAVQSGTGVWNAIWNLLREGMVFYGGLIGGIAGIVIVALRKKKNFFDFADLMAPCFCIAHAFGRVGCFLVGCCAGVEPGQEVLFGACTYDGTCATTYANGAQHLPVPLMEAIFLLLLSVGLVFILKYAKHRGRSTAWYLILYALWRFVIESFRGDAARGIYGAFSTSQWISFGILLAGVVIWILSRRWPKPAPLVTFSEDDLTVPTKEEAESLVDDEDEETVAPTEESAPQDSAQPYSKPAAEEAPSDEAEPPKAE